MTTDIGMRLKICVRSLLHRKVQCQPTTACCCHVFVPQYGRLAAVSRTGVISLRVSPKCTPHIIAASKLWVISSSERQQQNKTSPSHFPLLILPEFHSVSRCEGRKCIVLGLCNASLLSSLSHFLLLFLLLFVPQYGRLAAI